VICPGCGRKRRYEATQFDGVRTALARQLNHIAATVTDRDILDLPRNDREVRLWVRVVARELGVTDLNDLPPEAIAEAIRMGLPHLALVHAAQAGRPVLSSDFFLIQPPEPVKAPIGDPDHMEELDAYTWRKIEGVVSGTPQR
jgi:hypothetical protein